MNGHSLGGGGTGLRELQAEIKQVVGSMSGSVAGGKGLPDWTERPAAEAERRLNWARERVQAIG